MGRQGSSKGKRSQDGQYIPLSYAQLKSTAWRSLSGAAVKVWLELHTRYNGGNNGTVRLSLNEAVKALGISKGTAQRADTGKGTQVDTNDWLHWPAKTKDGPPEYPSPSPMGPPRNPSQVAGSTTEPVRAVSGQSLGTQVEH
jgi:hypothetical protein